MPKAEVGSTKYLNNKLKAKGLQRLRWFCQVCAKQCRDENGFKQHTLSEGHVRQMLLVGEDPKKFINNYSNQFKRDFLQLLRSSHGEKKVFINHFYQEYIRDKEHVHMNATKWPSLTEFAKYLGREGICKIEEGDRGLQIQWIDDSPEAFKRREDVRNKDLQAKGDEELEDRMLAQQIRRAKEQEKSAAAPASSQAPALSTIPPNTSEADTDNVKAQPIKISIGLGMKKPAVPAQTTQPQTVSAPQMDDDTTEATKDNDQLPASTPSAAMLALSGLAARPMSGPLSMKMGSPLTMKKKSSEKKVAKPAPEPYKATSAAERIMREEVERKRQREERGLGNGFKRARYD